MRTLAIILAAGIGLAMATPTVASDSSGYKAIAAGDFAGAARHLEAERKLFSDRPELMLNLAAAYCLTGRVGDARALYADVLDRPAVDMDMPSGDILSSHTIATRALARLSPALATR